MWDLTKLSPALASKVSKFFLAIGELLQFRHLNKAEASDAIDSYREALVEDDW